MSAGLPGKQTRQQTPPSIHTGWRPAADRPDPVALLEAQDVTREPDSCRSAMADDGLAVHLLPGRGQDHGGGSEGHSVAGLDAQLCGDAHLSNFGLFASPERRLLFDLNDFDETLPGRSSTTSSGWRRASRSRPATTDSPRPTRARRRGVGNGLPGGHGRVRADADDGRLVRPPGRGRADGLDPLHGGRNEEGSQGRARRGRRRRGTRSRKSWPR